MTDADRERRAAAIARARALMDERDGAPPTARAEAAPTTGGRAGPAKHPASASRIMAAGVAASAGLMLVATMAAAARPAEQPAPTAPQVAQPQVVHRVVTIEVPAAAVAQPVPQQEVTVVREVRTLPAPADAPSAAPASSEGS